MPTFNTVAWFQVGTDEPGEAKRFFGDLFGWRFVTDPQSEGRYDLVGYSDTDEFAGGIFDTRGETANHALFFVVVEDVQATVDKAQQLGAKLVAPPRTSESGLTFAHLLDTSGNEFGVFSPAPA
jgi:predicted enzyme related to lactoylglutathione lyase